MSRTMFRTHDATQAAAPHDRSDVIGRLGAHMTRLIADEEGHIDFLETQLQLHDEIGAQNFGLLNAKPADEAE